MTIAYISRLQEGESGNLGTGTFADPWRPVSNPAVKTWLASAPCGSVLCLVDAVFGASTNLALDAGDFRARPGQPLIISGDPARWGTAPATTARAQSIAAKAIIPAWSQIGATGIYEATLTGVRVTPGFAYNIDTRSDRGWTAVRDPWLERPTLVFHPEDCYAVPHTLCRTRRITVGTVAAGDTFAVTFPSSQMLTLTAVAAGPNAVNSPGGREFVIGANGAATATNIAAVVNAAQPVTLQVHDTFAGGARAAWWTSGAGTIADNDKCGAGSGFTLEIADAGHGLWKSGQSQPVFQLRTLLRLDAGSVTDGNSLRLALATNTASGEAFSLWLSRTAGQFYLGANTATGGAAPQSATLTVGATYVIEARFDAEQGFWWLWLDGIEIASGVAGSGPSVITDVGIVAAAGSGAASNWRLYVDDVRAWYENTAQPNLKNISAWAHGSAVYLPQLYGETSTFSGSAAFTATADVWLVHLAGEADPAARTWYAPHGGDNNLLSEVFVRAANAPAADYVFADMDVVFPHFRVSGLHASQSANRKYRQQRAWSYRQRIIRPNGAMLTSDVSHQIYDRLVAFDLPLTGPYWFNLDKPEWDTAPAFAYSKNFTANVPKDVLIVDSRIFAASCLWNATSLMAPDPDAHAIGVQSARRFRVENVQVAATSETALWFAGGNNNYPTALGPFHDPRIGGEDRAFWLPDSRPHGIFTGHIRYYWSEDQHRRISGNERSTAGDSGLRIANDGTPLDLDILGFVIRGWPYGAPAEALRFGPPSSGIAPGVRGIRCRGVAALWTSGLTFGSANAATYWPFHLYDATHPERPRTPQRGLAEQRRRPGAQWLGYQEGAAGDSVTALAVAFTPGAPLAEADLLATGALTLWLRKAGSPGNLMVSLGAGATPAQALAAPAYTATVAAASVSPAPGGGSVSVTLSGGGTLATGVRHWLILSVAGPSTANYYQVFGWWGGRYPALPWADLRAGLAAPWSPESTDFCPWFTLPALGHAPPSDFSAHVFALGSSAATAKLAQRFRPTTAFEVCGLQLWLAKHNQAAGATNLPVAVHADAGGVPGALVGRFLPASNAGGTQQTWTTHETGGAVYLFPAMGLRLAANTDYWLVIDAPQIDATHFYRVFGCRDGAADGFGAKTWDGGAWTWVDGTAQDRAKLYFTLYALPPGAARIGPLPQFAIDDMLVVSPRPQRNRYGAFPAGDGVIPGGTLAHGAFFLKMAIGGNRYVGGSPHDQWIASPGFDPAAPAVRGLIALGRAPVFAANAVYPAETADPYHGAGGASGLYRFLNYELAADAGDAERHRGQMTPAQWAERARAAGVDYGRDLLVARGS